MKYLILLDKNFPYNKGEAFLESELDYFSISFDKIIILSTEARSNDSLTRKVDISKVDYYGIKKNITKVRKVISSLRYFNKENKVKGIKKKLQSAYFYYDVNYIVETAIDVLKEYNIGKEDEVYIYSYWLFKTALATSEISDYFRDLNIRCFAFSKAHRFDIYEEEFQNKFLPFQSSIIEKLDAVYVISENGVSYLREKYPQYKDKIYLARLGTKDRGVTKIAKQDYIFQILTCSWIHNRKRLHLIIEALSKINVSKSICWTHIGSGNKEYEIKKLASKMLDKNEYSFLGEMNNEDVFEYYKNNTVNLFLNVSSSEGIPVSIMEAISFGVPIIATDVGGTSEVVIEGQNGYTLDKNFEIEELKDKIELFVNLSPSDLDYYSQNAREIWENNYSAKVNYSKFVETLENHFNKFN